MSVLSADQNVPDTRWRARTTAVAAALCLLLLPAVGVADQGSGGGGDSGPSTTTTVGRTDGRAKAHDPAVTTSGAPTPVPGAAEARTSREARCVGSGRIQIDLQARNGWIEIRSEIRAVTPTGRWRIIVSHERWIIWVGRKPAESGGRVMLRVRNKDYEGPDAIMVRANGPSGEVCRVVATIAPTSS